MGGTGLVKKDDNIGMPERKTHCTVHRHIISGAPCCPLKLLHVEAPTHAHWACTEVRVLTYTDARANIVLQPTCCTHPLLLLLSSLVPLPSNFSAPTPPCRCYTYVAGEEGEGVGVLASRCHAAPQQQVALAVRQARTHNLLAGVVGRRARVRCG